MKHLERSGISTASVISTWKPATQFSLAVSLLPSLTSKPREIWCHVWGASDSPHSFLQTGPKSGMCLSVLDLSSEGGWIQVIQEEKIITKRTPCESSKFLFNGSLTAGSLWPCSWQSGSISRWFRRCHGNFLYSNFCSGDSLGSLSGWSWCLPCAAPESRSFKLLANYFSANLALSLTHSLSLSLFSPSSLCLSGGV